MSYDSQERSIEDGRPIRLYRFTMGTTVWRYTSADDDLTVDGVLWKAVAIRDDGVKVTGDSTADSFTITASSSTGPAQVYMSNPPAESIVVERLATHEGVTVPVIDYIGEIVQVNFPIPGQAQFTCQTLSATMRRNGVRIGYQRTCPYALYDQSTCKVDKSAYAISATITSVDGLNIIMTGITGHGDTYFKGGFFEWENPLRGTQRMFIEAQTGIFHNIIVAFGDTSDLYPGLPVTIYPGCLRTQAACTAFSNLDNYGGFPWMPGKSPFDGTPFF